MAVDTATGEVNWLNKLGHNGRVYVLPDLKLVYMMTAKNACTTLKWTMAELAGEDLTSFTAGMKPYTGDEHAVHNRALFKKALYPDEVDPALAAQVHPDNGWFIFGVVRDPRSRLFSAWEDKLLMRDPAYRWVANEPWYPAMPEDADQIISEFGRYIDAALADPKLRIRDDTHFATQTSRLLPGRIPYTRIYPIEAMAQLHEDLTRHVQQHGWTEPIHLRKSNDTPLRANGAVFTPEVRAKVEQIYALDFETFGDPWNFGKIASAGDWTAAALRETRVRAELHNRLGEIRGIALNYRRQAEQAESKIENLRDQIKTTREDLKRVNADMRALQRLQPSTARRLTDKLSRTAQKTAKKFR